MKLIKEIILIFYIFTVVNFSYAARIESAACHKAMVGVLRNCNRPFCVMENDGIPAGLDVDMLNEVLIGSDLPILFRTYPTLKLMRHAFASGDINIIPHVAFHIEKFNAWFSSPYTYQRVVLVSKEKKKELIEQIQDGHEIGVSGSPFLLDYFSKTFPKAKIRYYGSVLQGAQAVVSGKLAILVSLESMIQSTGAELPSVSGELYIRPMLISGFSAERYSIPIRFAVSSNCKLLQNTIQHGLDVISTDRLAQIQSRWLIQRKGPPEKFLSSIDKRWFEKHGFIRVGLMNESFPYDRVDTQGRWVGVAATLLIPFFRNFNIPYKIILLPKNIDVVQAMNASNLDIVVATPYSPKLFDKAIISIPYDTVAWGLVRSTKRNKSGVISGQLMHFPAVDYHGFHLPKIILKTETTEQSLQALSTGKADMAAVSIEAASKFLLSNHAGNLYLDESVVWNEKLVLAIPFRAKILAKNLNYYMSAQSTDFLDYLHKYQHVINIKNGYDIKDVALYISVPSVIFVVIILALIWVNYRVTGFRNEAKKEAVQAMHHFTLADLESKNKTDFLAAIGHEVRTPMTGVLGTLSLLRHSTLTSEQKRQLDIATHSTELLQGKLNELLDFSKLESNSVVLKSELINLAAVVDNSVALFQAEAKKKQLALFSLWDPGVSYYCYGDEACIMQITSNLVSNAIKFTMTGEIVVRTIVASKNNFRIVVTDTGAGMTEAFQSKLFTFYSRENPEKGGVGLGLAITRKLARKMGGDIEVYSKLNKGSMFDVALPLGPLKGHEKFTEQASILLHDFRVFVHIRHEILREYVEKWLFHCNAKIVTVPPADISISDVSDIVILGIKTSLIPRSDFSCARLMEALAISIGKLENSIIPPHLTKFLNIGRGRKVLLVDDDAICRKIIQEQVMLLGFVVRAEESGYAALTAWREEIFDLTLMDLKLGDIHGYQLARKIRATDNWINYPCCFCILSAYSENKERERYIEEGFAGFIQKPCTVEQLADLLPSYMLHAGR